MMKVLLGRPAVPHYAILLDKALDHYYKCHHHMVVAINDICPSSMKNISLRQRMLP